MALRSVSLKVNSDLVGEISERSIEGILSDLKADGYIHSYRKTDKYYPGKDQKSRQNWEDRNGRDFIIVMRKRYGVFFEIPLQVKSSWEKLRKHKAYVYPDGSPQTIPCVATAEMYGAKIMPDLRSQIYDILDPFIEKSADEKWAYKARAAAKAANAKVKARNEKVVIEFLEKNPDATLPQVAEATGLCLSSVSRHRKKWLSQHPEFQGEPITRKAQNEKVVIEFLEKNPNATLSQIAEATGLSLATVYRRRKEWLSQHPEFQGEPITRKAKAAATRAKNEKTVIEFLKKNPDATLPQIAEATGLSLNTVLRHRKEWRRQRSEVSFPPIGQ